MWFQQTRPELEKILGYTLPKAPHFEPRSLREFSDPNITAYLRWRFPHLQGDALARAAADARAVSDSVTPASLIEGTNIVLIRSDNQNQIACWNKRPERAVALDFLRLAVIHEVVRWALDQRYDLARRRQGCRDTEEWLAWQAVVEGRAQNVTRQLALKLGMEKRFPLLAERFLHVADVSPDPGLRTTSQSAMRQLHWAYTAGRQFWQYLDEHGMKDEKEVFAHPPLLSQWIETPELYLRARQGGHEDLTTIMSRVAGLLPAAEWTVAQQAWTPAMVVQAAEALGSKTLAEKRVERWEEGRSLIWTGRGNAGRLVSLSVARFQNPAAARSFFNFTVDLERKADEKLNVSESRNRVVAVNGADEAVLSERKFQNLAVAVLRARVAGRFFELSWNGGAADLAWAEEVLRVVVR